MAGTGDECELNPDSPTAFHAVGENVKWKGARANELTRYAEGLVRAGFGDHLMNIEWSLREIMSFSVNSIVDKWRCPTFLRPAPSDRFDMYAGVVPDFLLDIWRELGFSGFHNGLYWICDPLEWQPVVDEWASGIDLPFERDEWIAVTRSAFGRMELWGRRTGLSLSIVPYYGMIFPKDKSSAMADDFERDLQIFASFTSTSPETLDPDGDDDRPLFKRVLKRLGPVDFDTMYGFVPVPALGGKMLPGRVEILDAEVHMHLLSQVTPRTLMVDNPYRSQ